MRVLQLVKTSHGARWALEQVQELCKMGVEVHVALPNLAGGFANAWTESGAKVHIVDIEFPARELWRLPSVISSFRNLVERVLLDCLQQLHRKSLPQRRNIARPALSELLRKLSQRRNILGTN